MVIRYKNTTCKVEVDPVDFSHTYWRKGLFYEARPQDMLPYMETYYKGKSIIDCGAHMGNHTLFFTKVMGCEVLSIEPLYFVKLLKNLWLNDVHATCYNYALSDKEGFCDMQVETEGNSGSAFVTEGKKIKMQTLDYVVGLCDFEPDVIKIDVERSNIPLLKGASETIKRYKPDIFIECADDFKEVETHLKGYGYSYSGKVFNATPTYLFTI